MCSARSAPRAYSRSDCAARKRVHHQRTLPPVRRNGRRGRTGGLRSVRLISLGERRGEKRLSPDLRQYDGRRLGGFVRRVRRARRVGDERRVVAAWLGRVTNELERATALAACVEGLGRRQVASASSA